MILLHGFGASTSSWRNVIPALAASFHVIAVDLNGFATPSGRHVRELTAARDRPAWCCASWLARARERASHGHSYGGGCRCSSPRAIPNGCARVLGTLGSHLANDRARALRQASPRPLPALGRAAPEPVRRVLLHSFYDDSLLPGVVHEYYERSASRGVDAYHGLTAPARTPSEPVELRRSEADPVVWGSGTFSLCRSGRRAAERMPNAEFALMEGVGHVPMEERPEALLRIVLPFL